MNRFIIVSLLLLTLLFAVPGARSDEIVAGPFSAGRNPGGPPLGWQIKDIKGKTNYTVIEENGVSVLRAESNGSASGLFRDTDIDPKKYPLMEWRWKVARVPSSANEHEKSKDDCAARVFVIFKDQLPGASAYSKLKHKLAATFSSIVPTGVAICYVWGSKLGKGETIESPYTDWVRIIAVESGPEKAGQWVDEQRNVVEDFKRLFGREPEKVVGVGIMTDMDQTGESITAFYRNVVFKSVAQ